MAPVRLKFIRILLNRAVKSQNTSLTNIRSDFVSVDLFHCMS